MCTSSCTKQPMNAVQAKKLALTEDTMLRAIAPVMRKRAQERRKADRKLRVNDALRKAGIPLRVV